MRPTVPSHAESHGATRERAGRRRRGLRSALAALTALAALAVTAPLASAVPWACDSTGYVLQWDAEGTNEKTLFQKVVRTPSGEYELATLGTYPEGTERLNALAFRPQDGFMYSYNLNTDEVVRIVDNGAGAPEFEALGVPIGLPPNFGTVVGTFLEDGTYFVWGPTEGNVVGLIIDVTTPTPTVLQEITPAWDTSEQNFSDIALNPADGLLYASSSEPGPGPEYGVFSYILDTGAGTLSIGERVGDGVPSGAQWFSPASEEGVLFQYENAGNLWTTDIASGALTDVGDAPTAGNIDATACANTVAVTKDTDNRAPVAGGEPFTYTYTIVARGLVDNPVEFFDQLPAGMVYVPGSVTVSPQFGEENDYGDTDFLEVSGVIERNTTVEITAQVRVLPTAPCEAAPNQAEATMRAEGLPPVTVKSDDPTTPENPEDPTTVDVTCEADLELRKFVPASSEPGGRTTWTIGVFNRGPSASSGSTVTDTLPAGVTNAASATPGCIVTAEQIECSVGPLEAGGSTQIQVTGTMPREFSRCVTNAATVAGAETDPNPDNDSATATTCNRARRYSVSLQKTASRDTVPVGGRLTYQIVATNLGPDPTLPTLTVTDTVPARLDVENAASTQGPCAVLGNQVSCRLGALPPGASATVLVDVVARRAGGVTNSAVLTGCLRDPCDTGQIRIRVEKPRLVLNKRASSKRVKAGQKVGYGIVVRNASKVAARDVEVCDRLPSGLAHLRSTKGAKLRKGRYCWTIDRLAAGKKRTFKVVARALRGSKGKLVNRAFANSPGARAAKAQRAVRVRPAPTRRGGVTG